MSSDRRASADSTASNPHIGASESTSLQFLDPYPALEEQACKKQRPATSVSATRRAIGRIAMGSVMIQSFQA